MSRISLYAELASEWPLTSLQCFAGNVSDSCALPRTAESCQTIQGRVPLMPEATHVRLIGGALQLLHRNQGGTKSSEGPGAHHGLSHPQLPHRGGREQQPSVLPPDPKHFAEQNAPLRISHAACPALARDFHTTREFLGRQTTYCQLNASRLCKVAQQSCLSSRHCSTLSCRERRARNRVALSIWRLLVRNRSYISADLIAAATEPQTAGIWEVTSRYRHAAAIPLN